MVKLIILGLGFYFHTYNILCLSSVTSIMRPYIPVTLGNCDRNSSIECYFNLD